MSRRRNDGEWEDAALHAYYDGELGTWARWRFGRRLARSPELRRELEALGALGDLVRESEAPLAPPDLWGGIAPRLAAADSERPQAGWQRDWLGLLERFMKPVAAVAVAGAAALALAFGLLSGDTRPGGVVQWVDSGDRNVIVLDEDDDVTVIWVFDSAIEGASRGGLGAAA